VWRDAAPLCAALALCQGSAGTRHVFLPLVTLPYLPSGLLGWANSHLGRKPPRGSGLPRQPCRIPLPVASASGSSVQGKWQATAVLSVKRLLVVFPLASSFFELFCRLVFPFVSFVLCLATCPQLLPKSVLHLVRPLSISCILSSPQCHPSAAYFFFLVFASPLSFLPSIFLSITCFRRRFQRKTWQIQLSFLPFI
jgi:hypothetical protein